MQQFELCLSMYASQGTKAMDFETALFLQSYFKTVCSVYLTIQTQFISQQQQGFLGFISIFSFFMCRAFCRGSAGGILCSGILGEKNKGPLLVAQDKHFCNCCNSAIIKYSIFRPCWPHSRSLPIFLPVSNNLVVLCRQRAICSKRTNLFG